MKKIFAILALAATSAAFAQSTVTISGNWDSAFTSVNAQDNASNKREITGNGSSTSNITFSGSEDLGGGTKASFKAVNLINTVSGQTGNGTTAYSTSNFFNDEIWIGLDGGFGGLKLGTPNTGIFETNSKAHPFGTALGGGYSSSGINRLLGQTTTLGDNQFIGGASANGRVTRVEKSVRYDTPSFAGFSANFTKAFQNDNSTTATGNSNGFLDTTVNYSSGPLNVAYSVAKADAGENRAQGNNAVNALTAGSSVKYQFFAANYTVGPATLYVGSTKGETNNLVGGDKLVKSNNVAVKYAVNGSVDLLANVVRVNDKAAAGAKDQDLTGLSAIYKFSKRTSTYATYQKYDTDRSSDTAGRVKQYLIGVRHQF